MKILDRYIGRAVLTGTLITLLLLLSLLTFFSFLDELRHVGRGNYDLITALHYMAYTIPRRIYQIMPVSALLGGLLSLGMLATNNELMVIRAAGVSILRIAVAVMKVGVVLMIVMFILGEFVAPPMEQTAQRMRAAAKTGKVTLSTQYGFWARSSQNYVNIRSIKPGEGLGDIYVYAVDDQQRLRVVTHAERAVFVDGVWLMQNVHQSKIEKDHIQTVQKQQMEWKSLLDPSVLDIVTVKPEHLSIFGLNRYVNYLRINGQDALRYEFALWNKVVKPLDLMIMLFLVVPVVLGSIKSVSTGQRVLIGVFIGIVFTLFDRVVGHLGMVYQFNSLISAVIPLLLFFILSFGGIYLVNRGRSIFR